MFVSNRANHPPCEEGSLPGHGNRLSHIRTLKLTAAETPNITEKDGDRGGSEGEMRKGRIARQFPRLRSMSSLDGNETVAGLRAPRAPGFFQSLAATSGTEQ